MKTKNPQDRLSPISGSDTVKKILLISFTEGACVMIAELAGSKMLTPFFGSSMYVWASTLSVTLGALTLGYYWGGILTRSSDRNRLRLLFLLLAAASLLVLLMPFISKAVCGVLVEYAFFSGMIISQLLFLFPPIFFLGSVSPVIIDILGKDQNSGFAAGKVYAISTLGGILATLLAGFWFIPAFGISIPCIVVGLLLLLISIICLKPGLIKGSVSVLMALILVSAGLLSMKHKGEGIYKVQYQSEGIMGQVKVVDFTYDKGGKSIPSRLLLVNNNWQTWIGREDPDFSFLYYTRVTDAVIRSVPAGSKALLIGLGGGSVARQLERAGINYEAVEIDERLPVLAARYFGLKSAIRQTVVDDGRHFINTCHKRYDLIIIDALLGENIPSQLLSRECFERVSKLLNPGGKLFIEFDGMEFGKEQEGKVQKMILNTLSNTGFNTKVYSPVPGKTTIDIIYLASLDTNNTVYLQNTIVPDSYFPVSARLEECEITSLLTNPTTDMITDDKPIIDYLLKEKMVRFREEIMKEYLVNFKDDGMDFFQ